MKVLEESVDLYQNEWEFRIEDVETVKKLLILRTLKNVGFLEIKRLLASENEFSSFQAAC